MGVKQNSKHFTTKLFNQNMINKILRVRKYSSVITALCSIGMQNNLTFCKASVILLLVLNKINWCK